MKHVYIFGFPCAGEDNIGRSDMNMVNTKHEKLPNEIRKDYMIRKKTLWEARDCTKAVLSTAGFIRNHHSNNPNAGNNRWSKYEPLD